MPQSVGIIGGGPGGMPARSSSASRATQVHVYDRYDRIGGLMIYGIPGFKLEKYVVERRAQAAARRAACIFHTDIEVGRDAALADLRAAP